MQYYVINYLQKVIQSSWRPDSFQVSTQSYSVPTTVLSKSMPCLPLGSPLYPISAEPTLSLNENILNDKELQNALASISEEVRLINILFVIRVMPVV